MHILVLGATGGCGISIIREALEHSHTVVVLARNPSKLPEDIKRSDRVKILEGQLTDRETLEKALDGVDAVVSALGPAVSRGPLHSSDTPLAKIYTLLIDVMRAKGVKRLVSLSTASVKAPEDKFDFRFWCAVAGVSTLAYTAYKDVVAIGKVVQGAQDLDWTLARVPILTSLRGNTYIADFVGNPKLSLTLNREAFGIFVINEVERNEWIHKIPMITCT